MLSGKPQGNSAHSSSSKSMDDGKNRKRPHGGTGHAGVSGGGPSGGGSGVKGEHTRNGIGHDDSGLATDGSLGNQLLVEDSLDESGISPSQKRPMIDHKLEADHQSHALMFGSNNHSTPYAAYPTATHIGGYSNPNLPPRAQSSSATTPGLLALGTGVLTPSMAPPHVVAIEKRLTTASSGGSQPAPIAVLTLTHTYELYADRAMTLTREVTEIASQDPVETFAEVEITLPAYEKRLRLGGGRKFDLNNI